MLTEFSSGSTILVDKPLGWTSFDAVNKLRWYLRKRLGVKKIKVGHAGTLDPLATGLLVICIGKHTKTIESLSAENKTYTGKFLLGKTTPSYDLETEFNSNQDFSTVTEAQIQAVCQSFLGIQEQVPPLYSAKQIDGKRAYDYARAGVEKVLKSNTIEITDIRVDAANMPEISFEIACTKGTYIRSIAHDFGQKLGCGATLIELRRTKSGEFSIDQAKSVEDWIHFIENEPL
jgi:tRNA pseudouridine55 synthase